MKTSVKYALIALLFITTMQGRSDPASDYQASLTSDFTYRDSLPQTEIPESQWTTCCGSWGPRPNGYPPVNLPQGYNVQWKRDRLIAVAEHYLGLPYSHRHIPAMGGLDCSNFTSWVYNYGFGILISSNVHSQAETAGRKLSASEPFEEGDLLYIWNEDTSVIAHTVIYVDSSHIIDSTGPGVAIRPFSGWYKSRLAFARRIFTE